MREMTKHGSGKVFLTVLAAAVIFMAFVVPWLAFSKTLFFGFMPAVWFWQVLVLIVSAVAFFIYLYNHWQYRQI